MILAYNLLGWFTIILGFAGLFSQTVPKWLALITMATGALAMLASFSTSRTRPYEPLVGTLLLLAVGIVAVAFHTAGWFPTVAFVFAAIHLGAAAEARHIMTREHPELAHERSVFWRRIHLFQNR